MAIKNLLHRDKLEEFKTWLIENGRTILLTKGKFEVLRWRHGKGVMPLIFNGKSPVHYSCNEASVPYIRKFIQQSKLK